MVSKSMLQKVTHKIKITINCLLPTFRHSLIFLKCPAISMAPLNATLIFLNAPALSIAVSPSVNMQLTSMALTVGVGCSAPASDLRSFPPFSTRPALERDSNRGGERDGDRDRGRQRRRCRCG